MLGTTKADAGQNELSLSGHSHSADDITSGILPLVQGGTGVSNLDSLKSLLGITSTGFSKVTTTQGSRTLSSNSSMTYRYSGPGLLFAFITSYSRSYLSYTSVCNGVIFYKCDYVVSEGVIAQRGVCSWTWGADGSFNMTIRDNASSDSPGTWTYIAIVLS